MLVAKSPDGKALIVVIDEESQQRMEKGDPFTLPLRSVGVPVDLELVIGTAPTSVIHDAKSAMEIISYVVRGYEKRPEDNYDPFKVEFEETKNEQ